MNEWNVLQIIVPSNMFKKIKFNITMKLAFYFVLNI